MRRALTLPLVALLVLTATACSVETNSSDDSIPSTTTTVTGVVMAPAGQVAALQRHNL